MVVPPYPCEILRLFCAGKEGTAADRSQDSSDVAGLLRDALLAKGESRHGRSTPTDMLTTTAV